MTYLCLRLYAEAFGAKSARRTVAIMAGTESSAVEGLRVTWA